LWNCTGESADRVIEPSGHGAILPLSTFEEETEMSSLVIEYYYKISPGGGTEWLALYKKNHNPILQQLIKEGILKSEKLYERRFHAETPAWDYKIVMVWRDWMALEEAHHRDPQIKRELYPDQEDHARQEKRRWELTTGHWDDVLKEVPLE
jgi:hypothetical protein